MNLITEKIHEMSNLSLSFERFGTIIAERERERLNCGILDVNARTQRNAIDFLRILYLTAVLFSKKYCVCFSTLLTSNYGGLPMT